MTTINTQQKKKDSWWCYATVKGYDFSFEGENYVEAQSRMVECVKKLGLDIVVDCKWMLPKTRAINFRTPKTKNTFPGYKHPRIDNF